jgi:hypothetical protein
VKRFTTLIALLAVTAVTGCGGSESGGADEALSFIPKDSPYVVTLATDPDGEQWQNVDDLLAKFPGSGQAKQQIEQALTEGSGGKVDFEDDIKPVLGNEFVVAASDIGALRSGDNSGYIAALKVDDEDKARELVGGSAKKDGTVEDADVYTSGDTAFAIQDGVLVFAGGRDGLEAALKRHADDSGMTEDDLDALMGGLADEDAIARFGFDVEAILEATPDAAAARKVPFIAALRSYGQTISVEDDGIESDFELTTEGDLSAADLPLAEGEESPAIVRRAGEIGFGLRNAAQSIHFAEQAAKLTDPASFADYSKEKQRVAKVLGIDVDRDLIDQFTGDTTVSVSLEGEVAFRAAVEDPEALKATLKKAAPRLEKLRPGEHVGVSTPPGSGEGLYAIAQPNGDKLVFGVVGDSFVAATDAARAGQVGGQSPSTVDGAEGAFAMVLDARSVVNEGLSRQGQGTVAQLVTGALGDFVGSVKADTDGLSGHFKLTIK